MENKNAVINFRLEKEKKQEILKFAYEYDLSITNLMLEAYEYYKNYLLENLDNIE